jgi:phosphoribosylamine---glycine ligase
MIVLVLGGGGREHALVKALKASRRVKHLSCAPGNPGIAQEAACYLTDPQDSRKVVELAQRLKPDLVVIGPEAPLAAGVADALRQHQFNVFGPSQQAAKLETSKVFSKEFMKRHKIPTAQAKLCKSAEELLAAQSSFAKPWVIKADGLAAGKGVRICTTENEFKNCVTDFFEKKTLGAASEQVLLEEYIEGKELSLMVLVAGQKYEILPVSQDHKRLLDGDKGPNTGGMGAFAPVKYSTSVMKKIEEQIVVPSIAGLKADGLDYRGILYIGIMLQKNDPYVLEYNVRFGDPEAQVILPLLDGDWVDVFSQVAQGKLPKMSWKKQYALCVVMAAAGYPDNPQKGAKIVIDRDIVEPTATQYLLHASTASHRGYFANGGRVLNAIGIDKTLAGARKKAYEFVKGVEFLEMHFRKDIGLIKEE